MILLALWPLPGLLLVLVRVLAVRRNKRSRRPPNARHGGLLGWDGATAEQYPVYLDHRVDEVVKWYRQGGRV